MMLNFAWGWWMAQGRFWRLVAKPIPTCFLQWELSKREGVQTVTLGLNETGSIEGRGPCTLTSNYD
jgi:hypothetical protein